MADKNEPSVSRLGRLRSLPGKILRRLIRLAIPIGPWLSTRVRRGPRPLIRLGTEYGGWTIVEPLTQTSEMYAVLCGAGEDVSLDLSLQARFGLSCVIADPTPRAIAHWRQISENTARDLPTPINGNARQVYDTSKVDFTKIEYRPIAVWTEKTELKFWSPANPDHVSHSAVNIQSTDTFIIVPADTLDGITGQPPEKVEIVKLDIEGAGLIIVDWMIQNDYLPNQILVEVEECLYPSLDKFRKARACVRNLEERGYDLVHFDGVANCTFAKRAASVPLEKEDHAA